jgi:hypothetical protein
MVSKEMHEAGSCSLCEIQTSPNGDMVRTYAQGKKTLSNLTYLCYAYHLRAHIARCNIGQGELATTCQARDSLGIILHEAKVYKFHELSSYFS